MCTRQFFYMRKILFFQHYFLFRFWNLFWIRLNFILHSCFLFFFNVLLVGNLLLIFSQIQWILLSDLLWNLLTCNWLFISYQPSIWANICTDTFTQLLLCCLFKLFKFFIVIMIFIYNLRHIYLIFIALFLLNDW